MEISVHPCFLFVLLKFSQVQFSLNVPLMKIRTRWKLERDENFHFYSSYSTNSSPSLSMNEIVNKAHDWETTYSSNTLCTWQLKSSFTNLTRPYSQNMTPDTATIYLHSNFGYITFCTALHWRRPTQYGQNVGKGIFLLSMVWTSGK